MVLLGALILLMYLCSGYEVIVDVIKHEARYMIYEQDS